MKSLRLVVALTISLAAASAAGAAEPPQGIPPPHHGGGIHGIIIHHCHPNRHNRWCHHHPVGVVGRPVGLGPTHPIGVPVGGPGHGGPVNGIPVEQRVQH
jgi:hypothetical protein